MNCFYFLFTYQPFSAYLYTDGGTAAPAAPNWRRVPVQNRHTNQAQNPLSIAQALQGTPQVPAFNSTMPKTLVKVYEEWRRLNLENFRDHDRRNWSRPIQLAFKKREYLIDYIDRYHHADQLQRGPCTVLESVQRMDRERGNRTVTQYMNDERDRDMTIKRRRKRRNTDLGPDLAGPTEAPQPQRHHQMEGIFCTSPTTTTCKNATAREQLDTRSRDCTD